MNPNNILTNKYHPLLNVLAISFGLWVFGLFISFNYPLKLLGFAGIATSVFLIGRQIDTWNKLLLNFNVTGGNRSIKYISIALFVGAALAILNNWSIHTSLVPDSLFFFALVAASIGSTEELIFRGFIQGKARQISPIFAIVFASFSHSIYKVSLFIYPHPDYDYPIIFLFLLTFVVGLLAGWVTEKSKSILPALLGHALFDILVYGGLKEAPFWVF